MYIFPCEWNYRALFCKAQTKERCLVAEETGARLIHGTRHRFEQKEVTTIWQAMYTAFEQVSMSLIYIMCGSRGGTGVRTPPLKNLKNTGFLSNTGADPLKNQKATKPAFKKLRSQHSILGHHRHASKTPFKLRIVSGPVMALF